MANVNNDVFSVLVTLGNATVLAAGNPVSALAVGQIGVFNQNTGLSISAATSPQPKEIFIAVGVDETGSGTLEDLRTSAGQLIQKAGLTGYSFKAHSAGQPEIQLVAGYGAKCDTDYAVTIELRNSRIYGIQGFNSFTNTYAVRTGCCDDCTDDCNSYDANKLTVAMVAEINLGGKVIATAVARQEILSATVTALSGDLAAGDEVSEEDMDAIIAYNATQADIADRFFTDFTIQSKPITIPAWNQVNLGFHKFLETKMIVSLVDGFGCGGTVTTTQELAYAQGTALNIQAKEYMASAWAGAGPYVLSETTGTSNSSVISLFSESLIVKS